MDEVCPIEKCAGCGACASVCPKNCISMIEVDQIGTVAPSIKKKECIACGKCKKVCPILSTQQLSCPKEAYAAQSRDCDECENAASGGIASAIYRFAIDKNYFTMATKFDRKEGVHFREVENREDIIWARDSKYVYSYMADCFEKYQGQALQGRKIVFLGLPCQCAAIRQYFKCMNLPEDLMITVEIICHGVPPFLFLDKHLGYIEQKKGHSIDKVTFRFPKSYYVMTCHDIDGRIIYRKPMHGNDTYYKAFSRGLIFRENCYTCKYAQSKRGSDMVVGDYSGLGSKYHYEGSSEQMSVVFTITEKGDELMADLLNRGYICAQRRPVDEPMDAPGNGQLRSPSTRHPRREEFLSCYLRTSNYEKAVKKALYREFSGFYLKYPLLLMKKRLRCLIPDRMKSVMKKAIKDYEK